MIPAEVAKRIDAEEVRDRVVEADRLLKQANTATSPTVAGGYREMAQSILKAQPRRRTERQVTDLLVKAAQASTVGERGRYRAAAEQVKADNPVAPRRRALLAKAGKDGGKLVAVYDQHGNLVGVCDRSKIQPVTPVPAPVQKTRAGACVRGRRSR